MLDKIQGTSGDSGRFGSIRVLGTPVSAISITRALSLFEAWMRDDKDHYVVCRDVHGVMRARRDVTLRQAHEHADLITPDGVPLVWFARAAGMREISRVCGPDLLPAVCAHGLSKGWRHYFYGSTPQVCDAVTKELAKRFPGLKIVGKKSPPFRELTVEEDELTCAEIRAAQPDFVWVALGTPKQEAWMAKNRGRCGGAILLGVGCAFDFCAGSLSRAPIWMQRRGLEWLYRLFQEPKRLWWRYIVLAPMFVGLALPQLLTYRLTTRARVARSSPQHRIPSPTNKQQVKDLAA
jgi:N-acetylglucosaminyldiphosphoundecaprenol N-acetyl-beta-D-mannosaminyltransferase